MNMCPVCNDTGIVREFHNDYYGDDLIETERWCNCPEGIKRHGVRIMRDGAYMLEQQQTELLLTYPLDQPRYYGQCGGDEAYRTMRRCVVNRWEPERFEL